MPGYRERLRPSLWWYPIIALIIPAAMLILAPVSLIAGGLTAAVLVAGSLALLLGSAPVIAVRDGMLVAGRARISVDLVGETVAARGADARRERGPALDARAWLLLRGDVDPVLRVPIVDDDDPTPYWLLSTRDPDALAAAIELARSGRPTRTD